jgi:hypothetical protein
MEQISDPQLLAALIEDGEWRTTATWNECCVALQVRQYGGEGAFEARLVCSSPAGGERNFRGPGQCLVTDAEPDDAEVDVSRGTFDWLRRR